MAKFKRMLLGCAASFILFGSGSSALAEVTITRDDLGVPAIEADTDAAMWMALGFVQARDRIVQMEILRQTAFGILPKLEKNSFTQKLDIENNARKTRNIKVAHKYHNLREQLTYELKKNQSNIKGSNALNCFAAGINVFRNIVLSIDSDISACGTSSKELIKAEPHKLSQQELAKLKQFYRELKLGITPPNGSNTPWSEVDVVGLFHLQVMDEFSNRNTEMNNLQNLVDLARVYNDGPKAAKVFNSMKWALDKEAATTIPANISLKAEADGKANDYHQNLVRSVDIARHKYNGCHVYDNAKLRATLSENLKYAYHKKDDLFPYHASNWWVVSQPTTANSEIPTAILFNGPQIAALDPARTYQVSLKSKQGFQFAGNTYPGTINFWQGYNGDLAFGLTAGNIDVSDVFCVDLKADGDGYYYQTDAGHKKYLEPSIPSDGSGNFLYHTKNTNWPVIAMEENPQFPQSSNTVGTAYIQRHNWQDQTVLTFFSWIDAMNAENLDSWNAHLDTVGGNFNLVALNKQGVAKYRLTGSLPIKDGMTEPRQGQDATTWDYYPSYDPRLPAPMAPDDGWKNQGTYFHGLSHTVRSGVFANWNQKPFVNMPDGDLDYDSYFRFDRVNLIKNELEKHKDPWTLKDMQGFNGWLQRADVNYFAYKPFLIELRKNLQSHSENQSVKPALNLIIDGWNGLRGNPVNSDLDANQGAHYGHILFYEFIDALTDKFAAVIANKDKAFQAHLVKTLLKPKQPYFPRQSGPIKPRPTFLTSHGIHINSRIILNALHSKMAKPLLFGMQNDGSFKYEYDQFQTDLIGDNWIGPLLDSLKIAIEKTKQYSGFDLKAFNSNTNAYFPANIATYSGLSNTIGANDVQIGFRKSPLAPIRHFRNRGALNIGVAFTEGTANGVNITHPGIREYRGFEGEGQHSNNQIPLYERNIYRPMNSLQPRENVGPVPAKLRSKL